MGTVTNPIGSVKGNSLTGLVDAYTGNWASIEPGEVYTGTVDPQGAASAQWQHVVLLSGVAGACGREGSGGDYAPNEITLRLSMVGYADLPGSAATIPMLTAPLVFTANAWLTTPDGVHRIVKPYFMKASKNGGLGTDIAATAGTITFTQMDPSVYVGSCDLAFNGTDRAAGSFVAPWCPGAG